MLGDEQKKVHFRIVFVNEFRCKRILLRWCDLGHVYKRARFTLEKKMEKFVRYLRPSAHAFTREILLNQAPSSRSPSVAHSSRP